MRLGLIDTGNCPELVLVQGSNWLPVQAADAGAPTDLADFLAWLPSWAGFVAQAPETGWRPLAGTRWLPPLSAKSRIFCVGKNYADHAKEMGMASGGPAAPDIFVRFPTSFAGHNGTIQYPEGESTFDFEGELAFYIGRAGQSIAPADAADHIFGYTAANDGSLRRVQKRTSQFTLGKNIDKSGALGPTIVPAADIADPQALALRTYVNDDRMQDGTTAGMTFDIATIVAVLSSVTDLLPGDIVLTGTPAGVGAGRTPPRFLTAGETVRVDIEGLDSLVATVAERAGPVV